MSAKTYGQVLFEEAVVQGWGGLIWMKVSAAEEWELLHESQRQKFEEAAEAVVEEVRRRECGSEK